MNYYNTFIRVAPDTPAVEGVAPKERGGRKPLSLIQYELIAEHPYTYTQEDIQWLGHVRHKGLDPEDATPEARAAYLQQSLACLRASPLPKSFGWGLHFDGEGKIALYAVDSPDYRRFAEAAQDDLQVLDAMRNKRAKA